MVIPVARKRQNNRDRYFRDGGRGPLAGLCAKAVRRHREPGDDYVVMTDPEGNEFCVCAKPDL